MPFLRRDAPSPPFQVRMPPNHGERTPPYAPVDGYMDHSRETTIPVLSQTISKVASAKTRFSSVNKLWKVGGPLSERLRRCSFVAVVAAGRTPQISLDLALEQCRARARSQPHMLEPTATAGGDGGLGEGVCVAGPLPGQPTTPHTKAALGGAAPGCFETGAGSIKARLCNGRSRFDLKASRAVE